MFEIFNRINQIKNSESVLNNLQNQIDSKQKELQALSYSIESNRSKLNQISSEINIKLEDLNGRKKELGLYQGIIDIQDMGLNLTYEPSNTNMVQISQELEDIRIEMSNMITYNRLVQIVQEYLLNNSKAKGEAFQKSFSEGIVIGFNTYFEKKRKAVTQSNFNKTVELINKKFDSYNRKANIMGISINKEYYKLCIKLLQLELDYKIAKNEEKEKAKEERRRLKEQEKMLAEAEKIKTELQKQRRMYEQSLVKALTEKERQKFEAKLKEIDKREADVDYRINNARAGYLYITATKAMPNVCKLGVTRRLNPLVRIQELSSASTPFPFVCYGLVFDDNAFDLETRVHEYFDSKRVNKENRHKEFFYVTPQEAIKVLQEDFNCEVHFVGMNKREEENNEID